MLKYLSILCILLFIYSTHATNNINNDPCSGRGFLYPDNPVCECNQCFYGDNCTQYDEDCVLVLRGGDPTLLQQYWSRELPGTTIEIGADYRTAYPRFPMWTPEQKLSVFEQGVSDSIRNLHKAVGNVANVDDYTLVLGSGGTNLVTASIYAMSRLMAEEIGLERPSLFVQPPHWYRYKQIANLPFQFIQWNTSTEQDPSQVLEVLTVPNNPDGQFNDQVYDTDYVIHDTVYYWPHWISDLEPLNENVMIFSMSKLTGHAGSRIGWALVKNQRVAELMNEWISIVQLEGNSVESLYRATGILNAVTETRQEFFSYGRDTLAARWKIIEEIFEGNTHLSIESHTGFFYLWIKCKDETTDGRDLFNQVGIDASAGSVYGYPDHYSRLFLPLHDSTFEVLVTKLKALVELFP